MSVCIEQVQGVWVVFGEGKYPHDPPRPASGLEIALHGQLQEAVGAIGDAINLLAGYRDGDAVDARALLKAAYAKAGGQSS